MKQTISEYDFTRAFQESDSRKDQFSYGALKAIFAYYEDYEESTGEELELDIIATCCEFTEYNDILEAVYAYNQDFDIRVDTDNGDTLEEVEAKAWEWLQDRTTVLEAEGYDFTGGEAKKVTSIVIANF